MEEQTTNFHKRIRMDRVPPFMVFVVAATIGFLFLNRPTADVKPMPYESELDAAARSLISTPTGDILVAGDFSRLLKINAKGELDKDFGGRDAQGFNKPVRSLANAEDGKIYVGGDFTAYNQDIVGYFAKLDAKGEVDSSFAVQMGTGFDDAVLKVVTRKNGHALIAGKFESYNGYKAPYLVELDTEGKLVRHFELNGPVHSISLIGDDAMAIGGDFSRIGDTEASSFAIVSLAEVKL